MMRLQAALAVGFLCLGVVLADCPTPTLYTCNKDVLTCCNAQFSQALNLTHCQGPVNEDIECYREEIERLYASSHAGTILVNSAYNQYRGCIGIAGQSCESVEWHVKNGMRPGDAMLLSTVYAQLNFMTGSGLSTYFNNDDCMRNVFINNKDEIHQCRKTFSANLHNNWRARCISFREFIGCVQLPFERGCGIESGWWGCEYQRGAVSVWLPECNEACSVTNPKIRVAENEM